MAKTITLRLDDKVYQKIKEAAEAERRSLSNFIENMTLSHLEECAFSDIEEMAEILSNTALLERLHRGTREIKSKKGKLIG